VALLGLAMLLVPRRYAAVPMLLMACFISPAQRVVIFSLDFNLLRLMILFGWARILLLGETAGFRWRWIDTALILWTCSGLAAAWLREGAFGAVVYRLGLAYDAIGMYLLFRLLIRSLADVEAIVRCACVIAIPVAAVFVLEHLTGRNVFAVFGGVSPITEIRDGRVRCRGPFPHPIYAGCFWAALMPLMAALWFRPGSARWLAPVGITCAIVVVITTASSTPLLAVIAAVAATAAFPFRRYLSLARWGTVIGLVVLHNVMQAPVWHLISRVDVVSGSTGWYRYRLIDGFIRGFDQWWFTGTRAYGELWGPSYKAVTNHFILEGVEGGLLTLALFATMIVLAFRGVGRLRRAIAPSDRYRQILVWAVGATLFVHCMNFLAVSYFGQVILAWYLALAAAGSLTPAMGTRPRRRRVPAPRAVILPAGHGRDLLTPTGSS